MSRPPIQPICCTHISVLEHPLHSATQSIYLFIHLPINTSTRQSIQSFIHLPICSSMHPSIHPSIYSSSYAHIYPHSCHPSVHPSLLPLSHFFVFFFSTLPPLLLFSHLFTCPPSHLTLIEYLLRTRHWVGGIKGHVNGFQFPPSSPAGQIRLRHKPANTRVAVFSRDKKPCRVTERELSFLLGLLG